MGARYRDKAGASLMVDLTLDLNRLLALLNLTAAREVERKVSEDESLFVRPDLSLKHIGAMVEFGYTVSKRPDE